MFVTHSCVSRLIKVLQQQLHRHTGIISWHTDIHTMHACVHTQTAEGTLPSIEQMQRVTKLPQRLTELSQTNQCKTCWVLLLTLTKWTRPAAWLQHLSAHWPKQKELQYIHYNILPLWYDMYNCNINCLLYDKGLRRDLHHSHALHTKASFNYCTLRKHDMY